MSFLDLSPQTHIPCTHVHWHLCPYIQHTSSGVMVPTHLLELMALCPPLHRSPVWLHAPPVRSNLTHVTSFITVARLTYGSNSGVIEGFELPTVGICCTSSFNSLMATFWGLSGGGIKVNRRSWVQLAQVRFSRFSQFSQFSSVQFMCFQ